MASPLVRPAGSGLLLRSPWRASWAVAMLVAIRPSGHALVHALGSWQRETRNALRKGAVMKVNTHRRRGKVLLALTAALGALAVSASSASAANGRRSSSER